MTASPVSSVSVPLFAVHPDGRTPGLESGMYNLVSGLLRRDVAVEVTVADRQRLAPAFVVNLTANPGGALVEKRFPVPVARSRFFEETAFALSRSRASQVLYPNYFVPPTETGRSHLVSAVIHDCLHHVYPEYFSATKRTWLSWQFGHTLRRADVTYLISEWERQMVARYHGDRAAERCRVIFNSIDWTRFDATLPTLPDWQERPFILSVCHPYPHKNVPLLIEAFGLLCERDTDVLLALSGQPSPPVRQAIAALPDAAQARLRFTGRLSDAELGQLYRAATAYVSASRYEGFGMPVVEALGFGLPTIVSAVGALPEVTLGMATLLPRDPKAADLADAMLQAVRTGRRLSAPQIEHVRQTFSPDAQAARFLGLDLPALSGSPLP